jgi:hypothetical protein
MNLLPIESKNVLKEGFKSRFNLIVCTLLILVVLVGLIMLLPTYFLTKSQLSVINYINTVNKNESEESVLKALDLPFEIDYKVSLINTNIRSLKVGQTIFDIIYFLPKTVKLNSLTFTKNEAEAEKQGVIITISGVANDRDSLIQFGNDLKSSKKFTEVEVPVSSLTRDKNLPFSVKIFIENKK